MSEEKALARRCWVWAIVNGVLDTVLARNSGSLRALYLSE
jgi:hypothetical protein